MAKNLDLSGIDFSESNQPQAQEAPGLDLSDIDLNDVTPEPAAKAEPEQEDSWGQVVYKSLSAMPERMQRSWAGLKQAIAPAFNNTDVDAQAESLINAAQQGVESAQAKLAELGFNPNDMGFINKGKLRQALAFDNVKDDESFKAARDEGIRLSAEIAKTAPKTGEQWSPKNLVSTILTGAQDMAPSVLLGLITKNPGMGLAEMTGQAYGSYYQDSIDKGLKPAEANNRATLFAALEPLTESIPMGFLLKPAGKGLTDLGKTAIAEGLQEGFTQAAQNAYDIGVLNEDMTVGQFLNDVGFNAVTGAGVGATLHGGIHGPGMVKEALNNRAVNNAAAGAASESGQAVPEINPGEYDAVSAEMGGDALDRMTEQAVPEINAARRQAYADARAAGLSPAEALQQARGQDTGADLLDQMVQDVFDSPDSVYYANKQSAVNPPQSVAEMVSQQAAQGDLGPVTGEMLGLPSPGQTSTIAMPGTIAPQAEPAGMRLTDTRDESRAPAPGYRPQLQIDDIVSEIEQNEPTLLALPRPDQTSTIAMPGPVHNMPEMTEPSRPRFNPTAQQDERAASIGQRPNALPPVPPAAQVELPPVPPSRAAELFGRKKKAAPVEEVDTEALAAEEARQAELKQKGDEAVSRMEQRADLPAVPGKKPAPLKVTRELVAAAKERGVEPGNKVNWNGKQYDVDKLQGRAVRLIDENGNGHIADIREVNAPEQQQTEAPKQALDVSDIDFTSDNMIEPGSDVDIRAEAWSKTIDAMSISEANDLADDVGIKRRPNVDVKAQLKNVHPDDLDASASPKQAMLAEQNAAPVKPAGAITAQAAFDQGGRIGRRGLKRGIEMPDGTFIPAKEVGAVEMNQLNILQSRAEAKADLSTIENQARTRYGLEPVAEDTDPRSLQQRLNDAQVETERSIGMAKDVQRGLDEMISEKNKDANAIEGEAVRVQEIPEDARAKGFTEADPADPNIGKRILDRDGNEATIVAKRPGGKMYTTDTGRSLFDSAIPAREKALADTNTYKGRVAEQQAQDAERAARIAEAKAAKEGTPLSKPVATSSKARHTFTEPAAPKGDVTNPKDPAYSAENARRYRKHWLDSTKPEKIGTGGFELRRVNFMTPQELRGDDKNKFLVTKGDTTWAYPTRVAAQAGMHEMRGAELDAQKAKAKPAAENQTDDLIGKKVDVDGTEYTITGKTDGSYVAKADGKPMEVLEPKYAQRLVDKKKPSGAASIKESKAETKGMKPEEVAKIATEFVKNFKGVESVDLAVMGRQADLGIDIPDGSILMGFYDMGNISSRIVAENLNSREEVEALLRHELIVHYGLRARLSKQDYDAQMDTVLAAENSPALRKLFEEARSKYDDFYDISSVDGQRMIAEEVVALAAENPKVLERSGVIRRVIEAIRQLLIKAKILPNTASMESVHQLIQANAEYLRNTTIDRNDVRVSLPPMGYNAPKKMAPAMNKKTDIDDAAVPDDIKDGMRDTMYRDTRSFTQRIKDMMADNFNVSGIYQGAFDDLHAIARYEKMSNNGQLKMGRESAYKFSMLAKNINSIVAVAMNKGAPVYQNGTIGVNKDTKGFTQIFEPVMALKGNMLPVWEYWAGAVRAKRLLAEGREQLYTQKQVDDIIDYVNRRPELRKAFNEAHRDWRALNKAVLDFGEATGIVDTEARKLFESDDYVPFYRVDEEADKVSGPSGKRGLANQSSGIRRLKGGEGKLDILENMARNVNHIISSGFKNAAMQRVKDVAIGAAMEAVPNNFKPVGISNDAIKKALNDMGVATSGMSAQQLKGYTNLFTAVAPAGPNIITIRYDGKPQYFEVTDPQLMRSITGIGPERLHAILKILAIPKKVLTRTVTSTPTFIATNMTRDIAGNFVQMAKETGRNTAPKIIADIMTLRPVYRAMAGAYKSITKHGQVTDYQVSGGMSGGYDQSRPEGVAKHLRNLHKRNVILDTPKKLWDAYETLLTASEQATRMAVYDDVLKNTGDPVEAAYQANDVMNFSRRGDNVLTHVLISTVPFLNARMQGLDRLARGAIDSPKAFLLKGAIITAATMALMAMNADDEDYWALPEYERDMFWIIPANGVRYRIPKPFEVGAVFGTIPERIFEATFRQDHMFKDRMGFMLANTFAVDLPQFVKPIYEDQANMNSFTQRPIVPMALQRVQPNQQYSTSSPEWIKGLAKMMPEAAPEWMRSPLRLQHMIEGYTGSMGQYVVSTSDAMYNSLFTDKVMPAKREYDMPVIKAFVRGGEANDKYVDRLYQMSEKAGQFYGTLKAYKDQKMMEEYRKFKEENSSVLAARRNIDKAVARMQKLNKQTKAIYANDAMTPEAKREALDKLTVQKNDLAKEVSDKYWMLF
nr:MAG: Large polyvalent protein associated domain 38 [Bacteriophage sp.]